MTEEDRIFAKTKYDENILSENLSDVYNYFAHMEGLKDKCRD